jgi:hypothetical protein
VVIILRECRLQGGSETSSWRRKRDVETEPLTAPNGAISQPIDDGRARMKVISLMLIAAGIIAEVFGIAFSFFGYLTILSNFSIQIDPWISWTQTTIMMLGMPTFLTGLFLWVAALKTGDAKLDRSVKWSFGISMVSSWIGLTLSVAYYLTFITPPYSLQIDYFVIALTGGLFTQLGLVAALIGAFLLIRRAIRKGLNFPAPK